MKWNLDLMSGEPVERTLRTVIEGVEAGTAEEAIRSAVTPEMPGHDWPITGAVAQEPGGIRYWLATEDGTHS